MIWLFLLPIIAHSAPSKKETNCLVAYQNIAARLLPPNDAKISETLQARLLEVWEKSQNKMAITLQDLQGNRVPPIDEEWVLMLRDLQEQRSAIARKVDALREQRRLLKEKMDASIAQDKVMLQAQKNYLDQSVNTLMAEIEAISEILLPVREWVGLSVIQSSASELAKKNGALVIFRNTPSSAAGQLIKSRQGKSIQFKFQTSNKGVIAGLVPRDQSLSKAVLEGPEAVAKKQAEVDMAIQEGLVNAHPFQIGTLVAVHRDGIIKFVDKSREAADPKEIVEVLSLVNSAGQPKLLVSDVDVFAFGFKKEVPAAKNDSVWGVRNSLEQDWADQFNFSVNQKLDTKNGRYITHGPENRNPQSSGVSGYPLTAYFPDGTLRLIPQGPNSDPDKFLKAFYQEARQQGFKLEENPLWGWP